MAAAEAPVARRAVATVVNFMVVELAFNLQWTVRVLVQILTEDDRGLYIMSSTMAMTKHCFPVLLSFCFGSGAPYAPQCRQSSKCGKDPGETAAKGDFKRFFTTWNDHLLHHV